MKKLLGVILVLLAIIAYLLFEINNKNLNNKVIIQDAYIESENNGTELLQINAVNYKAEILKFDDYYVSTADINLGNGIHGPIFIEYKKNKNYSKFGFENDDLVGGSSISFKSRVDGNIYDIYESGEGFRSWVNSLVDLDFDGIKEIIVYDQKSYQNISVSILKYKENSFEPLIANTDCSQGCYLSNDGKKFIDIGNSGDAILIKTFVLKLNQNGEPKYQLFKSNVQDVIWGDGMRILFGDNLNNVFKNEGYGIDKFIKITY